MIKPEFKVRTQRQSRLENAQNEDQFAINVIDKTSTEGSIIETLAKTRKAEFMTELNIRARKECVLSGDSYSLQK